jgi:hypothetical protein
VFRDVLARLQEPVLHVIWSKKCPVDYGSIRPLYRVKRKINVALCKKNLFNSPSSPSFKTLTTVNFQGYEAEVGGTQDMVDEPQNILLKTSALGAHILPDRLPGAE